MACFKKMINRHLGIYFGFVFFFSFFISLFGFSLKSSALSWTSGDISSRIIGTQMPIGGYEWKVLLSDLGWDASFNPTDVLFDFTLNTGFTTSSFLWVCINNNSTVQYSTCNSNSGVPMLVIPKIVSGVNSSFLGNNHKTLISTANITIYNDSSYTLQFYGPNGAVNYFSNFSYFSVTFYDSSPLSGIDCDSPSGSIEITNNGIYDVTSYSEAIVNVSTSGGSSSNYSQELRDIKTVLIYGIATILVLYFFYCIYRLIIKSTGRK